MYAIVAVDEKWGIGRDNRLLFHLPADLKRFKELTSGHTVLMGRRTLQSEIVHSPAEALLTADEDSWVIGGESVYRMFLPLCDRVYMTRIAADGSADAFFPDLEHDPGWRLDKRSADMEEDGLRFRYEEYVPVKGE